MKTITLSSRRAGKTDLMPAVKILNASGVIVHATETVYGLAAKWDDPAAIQRVSELKKRSLSLPYSIMVPSVEQIPEIIGWNTPDLKIVLDKILPAPITLILPRRHTLQTAYWNQFPELGFRMPDHTISRALLHFTGSPLITTSANISGEAPPVKAEDISPEIADGADLIVDSGPCQYQEVSSVVRLKIATWQFEVLRSGAFPIEKLQRILHALESGTAGRKI